MFFESESERIKFNCVNLFIFIGICFLLKRETCKLYKKRFKGLRSSTAIINSSLSISPVTEIEIKPNEIKQNENSPMFKFPVNEVSIRSHQLSIGLNR